MILAAKRIILAMYEPVASHGDLFYDAFGVDYQSPGSRPLSAAQDATEIRCSLFYVFCSTVGKELGG